MDISRLVMMVMVVLGLNDECVVLLGSVRKCIIDWNNYLVITVVSSQRKYLVRNMFQHRGGII